MKPAVNQTHSDVDQIIAGQIATLHCVVDSLFSRLDELARNGATLDFVLENKTLAWRGLDLQLDMGVLTAATRLLLENLFACGSLRNRLAIGDLRLADVGFNAELALHAIDNDL